MNNSHVIWLISKVHNDSSGFLEQELKKQGIHDLVVSQGAILGGLFHNNGRMMMKDIAARINKDKSTVTYFVNKLSQAGYVRREKGTDDARETYIVLTQKAWDCQEVFQALSQKLIQTAYEGFSQEEQTQLMQLLEKMHSNFQR
ncbi:MAG TPA: MarR family transcriptional regulator [Patescibacteria group bacterium]|nr:MarR family transcriptional regulator [Patescibacteria group bacterium]